MKGFIVFAMCLLSLGAFGAESKKEVKSQGIIALKTHSGKSFEKLSLQESTKVLESLEADENIELRDEIIYPEEVSEVIIGKLTKARFTEKRPNPNDYN